eukprot:4837187-Pyramimonas_sp.AAC.1
MLSWVGRRMRMQPLGPSVELSMGPRSVVLGGADACEPCHWGLRWSSRWGHETCKWCAERGGGRHADPAIGAFSGAPYGATK